MMTGRYLFWALPLLVSTVAWSAGQAKIERTPSPQGAKEYFISPKDGQTLKSPITVRFGLEKMGIAPAGVHSNNTGHHHLLINSELKDLSKPIPSDEHHLHFGAGQTETTLDLPPGKYKLQLVLGDHRHIPHNPVVKSKVIEITVKK